MSYEELIQKLEEYKISLAAKANAPSWFVTNIKTLLSKNITIEDWNSVQKYLRNNSSDIVTVDTMIQDIIDFLSSLKKEIITDTLIVKNIYKGEESSDTEILSREEIKEEFLEKVTTGNKPRVYGVDSNDEQVMYEVRNQTIPNSIVQRDANGRAYILTPTQPAHIANKGYVDGEITTLRDESMNYTDDEVAGAIAGLKDDSGKIRSDLLPSYVDDVVEYSSKSAFPAKGEKGKIYLDLSTNEIWRWSSSEYFEIKSGDYFLRADGEKLVLDLEKLEKVTPTDIVADGNTIKLYHDSIEITGQENPVTFKTVNGVSVIGVGDIETDNIQVLDTNFDLQTLVPLFADLSDLSNNITDYSTLQDRMGFVKILGSDSVKMQFFVGLKDSEDETAGTITYKLYQASCVINGNVVEDWTIDYENKSNSVYVDLNNNVLYRLMTSVEVPYYTYERNIDTLIVLLAKEINEELLRKLMESKADTDGYYPQMRVGLSDNLYSPDGVVDEIPYTFRETAGTLNVETGNAEIQSVKGNTIVWNQLAPYNIKTKTNQGITITNNGDGSYTFSGTTSVRVDIDIKNVKSIAGHKYLMLGFTSEAENINGYSWAYEYRSYGMSNYKISTDYGQGGIFYEETENQNRYLYFVINSERQELTLNDIKCYPQLFDLTQMFGAGNEPATVEEFRSLFPNPYYEYNPGELKSVNVTGIKTVGFNAFDIDSREDTEFVSEAKLFKENTYIVGLSRNGYYRPEKVSSYSIIDGKITIASEAGYGLGFPIKVIGGKEYEFTLNYLGTKIPQCGIGFYDQNYNYIEYTGFGIVKTPINAYWAVVVLAPYYEVGSTETFRDVCFHLTHTGYKNGTYEPYWTETRYIANALELRSAGSAYDELTKDKKITRIGVVDLGTLIWNKHNNASSGTYLTTWWSQKIKNPFKGHTVVPNINCIKYKTIFFSGGSQSLYGGLNDNVISITASNEVAIVDSSFDDYTPEQVQQALSGVLLYYELADYVEEPLSLQNLTYKVDDFGTEEWLQTSDIPVPVAHSTLYMRNLRDDVRTLPTTYATKEELNKINTDINVTHYNYDISPATAVVGTLTSEIVTSLSEVNATITRAGELYRYSDKSDSEYLTYVHASIDTSQSDKPAVMRAIRINLTTYAWELLDYQLVTQAQLDTIIARISALEEK